MSDVKKQMMNVLSREVRNYRKANGLTQDDMAELLYISPRSYRQQEHGSMGFSIMPVFCLLEAMPTEARNDLVDRLCVILREERQR